MPLSFSGFRVQTNGSGALVDITALRLIPAMALEAGSTFNTTPSTHNAGLAIASELEIRSSVNDPFLTIARPSGVAS
jgi:hypothetical protein